MLPLLAVPALSTIAAAIAGAAASTVVNNAIRRVGNPLPITSLESKEEREARYRSYSRKLKENDFELLGNTVETISNVSNALDNFMDANPVSQAIRFFTVKEFTDKAREILKLGDHVAVDRWGNYTHHGIYGGDGNIMEYDGGEVKETSLDAFFEEDIMFYKIDSEAIYTPNEIWRRACSRRGEKEYNLLWNNCEHFARWCRNGERLETNKWLSETTTKTISESDLPPYFLKKIKENNH